MKKKLLLGFSGLIAVVLIYVFLFQKKDKIEATENIATRAIVVRPMTLKRGDLNISVSATGTVTPINVVEIKCKAGGLIETLNFEESDRVYVGKIMVTVDSTDTRNAFQQAFADSEVAIAQVVQQADNLKRAKDLLDKSLISQQDFDQANVAYVQAKASFTKATANLVSARQKLSDTVVRSPINGLVLTRGVSQGQIIASATTNVGGGTTIAQVADMSNVYVTAAVDEVDIGKVGIGERAKIVADAYPMESFYGKVIRVASQATVVQNVTTFNVVIEVANFENKLKSGMNATITIQIANKENVMLIPNDLLRSFSEVRADLKTLTSAGVVTDRVSGSPGSDSAKAHKGRGGRSSKIKKGDLENRSSDHGSDSTLTKFVVALQDNKKILISVKIGLSDADNSEIVGGLSDTTTVYYVKYSDAKKDADQFKQMLKGRSGFSTSK